MSEVHREGDAIVGPPLPDHQPFPPAEQTTTPPTNPQPAKPKRKG